jgi:hypothetical protein
MRMVERGMRGGRARLGRIALVMSAMCLSLAAGCMQNNDPETEPAQYEPTYIRVENRAFLDMNIYVYRSSQRIRLGQATGNSTTRFRIPNNLLFGATGLRFQADPIGGNRTPISQEISVSPGDEVNLVIPPN